MMGEESRTSVAVPEGWVWYQEEEGWALYWRDPRAFIDRVYVMPNATVDEKDAVWMVLSKDLPPGRSFETGIAPTVEAACVAALQVAEPLAKARKFEVHHVGPYEVWLLDNYPFYAMVQHHDVCQVLGGTNLRDLEGADKAKAAVAELRRHGWIP